MRVMVERREQVIRTFWGDFFATVSLRHFLTEEPDRQEAALSQEFWAGFIDAEGAKAWVERREIADGMARLARGERLVWEGRTIIEEREGAECKP